MIRRLKVVSSLVLVAFLALFSSACNPSPNYYTVGGTVSGLTGSGLVLQNEGGSNLAVSGNGSFALAPVLSGTAYNVTVLTQPNNPSQICTVTNGSGHANATVTNIQVTCGPVHNEWAWIGGSDAPNQPGNYGTQGVAASTNIPPAQWGASSWTDLSGNVWLFGGNGYSSSGPNAIEWFNDLWEYSAGEWTWVAGSQTPNQPGVYGTLGAPAPTNVPGSRVLAATSTDASGNLWLFGGLGCDSTPSCSFDDLNDLWEYSAGEWTWMGGSSVGNQIGMYGTQGTPGGTPGGRYGAVTWIDGSGHLWLFGGEGLDSEDVPGPLNDLWEFAAGQWTWVSGSNESYQAGSYGTIGVPSPSNVPDSRYGGVSWKDASGNFWLFGGYGSTFQSAGFLNDLWEYSGGEWTWMGPIHSNSYDQPGSYGTQGTPSPDNSPGGRSGAVAWIDASGSIWLFGGQGIPGLGPPAGSLNDLWRYSAGEWTWMTGSSLANQLGTYGTQGDFAAANTPGSRSNAVGWIDKQGSLWLFSGNGGGNGSGFLNDLWEYIP